MNCFVNCNSLITDHHLLLPFVFPPDNDHILFGLVLGILCGIFIVLVIFSVVLVVFFRRHHHPKVVQSPVQELVTVDGGSTDDGTAGTLDENQDANTETTEKMTLSAAEFNPLLVVNPVQKPPRLGIPDVSSSEYFLFL